MRALLFSCSLAAIFLSACGGGGGGATGNTPAPAPRPAAAAPILSPAPGTYSSAQSVNLSTATSGATIYYTTDGSAPTAASTRYTAPISVTADTTITAIALASGFSQSPVTTGAYLIAGPSVSVVLSKQDQSALMASQPAVTFTTTSAGTNKIIVDETEQYQTVEGFGASFTDSACYLLYQVQPASTQDATLHDLFTRDGSGIGLSFMRLPMGASDIARSIYSYAETPSPQPGNILANFSIAHDSAYVLPVVHSAKALNPNMKLMANPWSPPAWMKSTNSMIRGTLQSGMQGAFANYFVKFLQAYQAVGIPIDYISLQNEPLFQPTDYPGMYMDAASQRDLLRDYVLPALTANSLTTKVLIYDHNWDATSYPETVLADPVILASPLLAGTAWHGYGGPPGAQQKLQNEFPTKGNWQTEHSGGTWVANQFQSDFVEITAVMRSAGKSYVKWSLALDENLGPNLTTEHAGGGCATCTPIVTVNSRTGAVTRTIEYYTLGHYSRYVLPGAVRVYSSNANGLDTVAFQNPDKSKVLVAYNNTAAPTTFQVQWGIHSFAYTLPVSSAATFTWTGAQTGAASISAKSQIQASSYSSVAGMQMEMSSDANGGYDLGFIDVGAKAIYKNIDFGSGVTQLNLRAASGGSGGAAEFHLDSATGPLVSTVNIPVTGGWQTWHAVSATATGATGIHDLYVVFTSGTSGNLANVNWFQFQ